MSVPNNRSELYQQVILEHNKNPRNYREIKNCSHHAEGYNPLCGDHLNVYLTIANNTVQDISFIGDGCAISKASASMMTQSLKGRSVTEVKNIFEQFHSLINGKLNPDKNTNSLGRLAIFSNIWHFPARVKCASLCWHTMKGALEKEKTISTE